MSTSKVIRAWKDPDFRNSLSPAEQAAMPANPAGSIEITGAELGNIAGGRINMSQFGLCPTHACSIKFTNCFTQWPICQG